MVSNNAIEDAIKQTCKKLIERRIHVRTAESCTGGGIVNAITNVDGASKIIDYCMTAYSPEIKQSVLNIEPNLTKEENIVSKSVSKGMAKGLRDLCNKRLSIPEKHGELYVYVGITGWIGWAPPKSNLENTAYYSIIFKSRIKTYCLKTDLSVKDKSINKRVMILNILQTIYKTVMEES